MKRLVSISILYFLSVGCFTNQISDMKIFLEDKQRQIDAFRNDNDHRTACNLYNQIVVYLRAQCPDLEGQTSMCDGYKLRETEDCSKHKEKN